MYVLANSDVLGEYERSYSISHQTITCLHLQVSIYVTTIVIWMFEEFMMQTHHGIIQEDVWSNFANLFPKWLEDYVRFELSLAKHVHNLVV